MRKKSRFTYLFTTPPTKIPGDPASLVNFLTKFNFDTNAPQIFATDGIFKESAMDFMTPPDVADPKLADFKARDTSFVVGDRQPGRAYYGSPKEISLTA